MSPEPEQEEMVTPGVYVTEMNSISIPPMDESVKNQLINWQKQVEAATELSKKENIPILISSQKQLVETMEKASDEVFRNTIKKDYPDSDLMAKYANTKIDPNLWGMLKISNDMDDIASESFLSSAQTMEGIERILKLIERPAAVTESDLRQVMDISEILITPEQSKESIKKLADLIKFVPGKEMPTIEWDGGGSGGDPEDWETSSTTGNLVKQMPGKDDTVNIDWDPMVEGNWEPEPEDEKINGIFINSTFTVDRNDPTYEDAAGKMAEEIRKEIDINITKEMVTGASRKLKATWSVEQIEKVQKEGYGPSILVDSFKINRQTDLMLGFKSKSIIESGFFFAPYIPIYTTPIILDWDRVLTLDSPLLAMLGFVIPAEARKTPAYAIELERMGWVFPLSANLGQLRKEDFEQKQKKEEIKQRKEKIESDLEIYARIHKELSIDPYKGSDKLFPPRKLDMS